MKKSSQSKKVMKMLDKERRRKKHLKDHDKYDNNEKSGGISSTSNKNYGGSYSNNNINTNNDQISPSTSTSTHNQNNKKSDSIQTEIRTDDFVVRLLLSVFVKYYAYNLFKTKVVNFSIVIEKY